MTAHDTDEHGNRTDTCGVCTLAPTVDGWARMTQSGCPVHGTSLRTCGAYLTIHAGQVARTVQIRTDLHVDLAADGRVIGVESISGPVTVADLATVLFTLPFELAERAAARGLGISPETPQ